MQWNNKQMAGARQRIFIALRRIIIRAARRVNKWWERAARPALIIYLHNERYNKADCSVIVHFKLNLIFYAGAEGEAAATVQCIQRPPTHA